MPEAVQGAGKRPSLSCRFCCLPLGAESPAHRCIWQRERWRRGLQPRPPWPSLLLFTGSFTLSLSIFRTAPRPTLCFHQVQRLFPVLILNSETPGATGKTEKPTRSLHTPAGSRPQSEARGRWKPAAPEGRGRWERIPGGGAGRQAHGVWSLPPGLLHPTPGPERVWGWRAAIGDPGVLGADPAPTAAGSWKHRALDGKRAENVP